MMGAGIRIAVSCRLNKVFSLRLPYVRYPKERWRGEIDKTINREI